MVSAILYHAPYSSMALYHVLSSLVDMGVVIVATDPFVTFTLARSSVPFVSSRGTSHGSILSQIALSFGCAASNCSTVAAG